MDIKLKARLAAYTKVDAIGTFNNAVPKSAIANLFDPSLKPQPVTKDDIYTLFPDEEVDKVVERSDIDKLFNTNVLDDRNVTYAEIDSLFD